MDNVKRKLRCAVYTRKSTEEGLDQKFTSIDAQQEAGHSFIASRRGEGWVPIDDDYDDPGFSGGNIKRPAYQRLMRDVKANKIDIIVVYKVDRLTRNLVDFVKLVELLKEYNVSFVSVTEPFDTSTAMGRMILNQTMVIAQFFREDAAERIRDKFRISKQNGHWMGGNPPLGYDVVDRKLVINQKEAALVQDIFRRFVQCGSTTTIYRELKTSGTKTKTWTTQAGKVHHGRPMTIGYLYKLLNNKIYMGYIRHKKSWYKGKHMAIIDSDTWDKVEKIFSSNHRQRSNLIRSKDPFLLQGIIFDNDGYALTTYRSARKSNGRRYRYYVSSRDRKTGEKVSGLPNIPAEEIEAVVIGQIKHLLKVPPIIEGIQRCASEQGHTLDQAQITVALHQIENIWDSLFPIEQSRIVNLIAEKIIVHRDKIEMPLHHNGFEHLALELARDIDAELQSEEDTL